MGYIKAEQYVEYYRLFGLSPVLAKDVFRVFFARLIKNVIVISDSRFLRKLASILKIPTTAQTYAETLVENHFALMDALDVLKKKHVSVFFYNRIGLNKHGFEYSRTANYRMEHGLNFPKLIEEKEKYKSHLQEIFGAKYSDDYLSCISKIPQIVKKGNVFCHEDCSSKLVNVLEGKRVVCYKNNSQKNIHIYGRCGAFGYAVSDEDTFPSQLQKLITENKDDFRIINHGLWGGDDRNILHNFFYDVTSIKEGDIVLFYMKHFDKKVLSKYMEKGLYYKEITDEWHKYPEASWCFYDKPGHMNDIGYKHVAEIIYKDLKAHNFNTAIENDSQSIDAKYLNNYLKFHSNLNLSNEVAKYIDGLIEKTPSLKNKDAKIGSIVMNCNPFTFGHRYLAEYAAGLVDKLIIFVVEEDKSFFKFADRFEMVKKVQKI